MVRGLHSTDSVSSVISLYGGFRGMFDAKKARPSKSEDIKKGLLKDHWSDRQCFKQFSWLAASSWHSTDVCSFRLWLGS